MAPLGVTYAIKKTCMRATTYFGIHNSDVFLMIGDIVFDISLSLNASKAPQKHALSYALAVLEANAHQRTEGVNEEQTAGHAINPFWRRWG